MNDGEDHNQDATHIVDVEEEEVDILEQTSFGSDSSKDHFSSDDNDNVVQ